MRRLAAVALLALAGCAPGEEAPAPTGPAGPPITLAPAPRATPETIPSIPPPAPPPQPSPSSPPSVPGDECDETLRGWAFYRADWAGGSCTGDPACSRVNVGGFPRGVRIVFDSTAHPKPGQPMPAGCEVEATEWSISPPVPLNSEGAFAMVATFKSSGTYMLTASSDDAEVDETGPVRIR